jgi:hypothetical protein
MKKILIIITSAILISGCGGGSKNKVNADQLRIPLTTPNIDNGAPTITGIPSNSVVVNTQYSFIPRANDIDDTLLVFSIINEPSWASFDPQTGELAGTPSETGIFNNIIISVSDKTHSTSLTEFSIIVTNNNPNQVNIPPTITGSPIGSLLANNKYIFIPIAEDDDNDPLTFSITNKPNWATFDTSNGKLEGTPKEEGGSWENIVISAFDGQDTASLTPFSINTLSSLHNVSIAWEAPTENIDGDDIENITGYKVMYGKASEEYDHVITITDPNMTSTMVSNLERTDYYFSMKTTTLNGIESDFATEYVYEYNFSK